MVLKPLSEKTVAVFERFLYLCILLVVTWAEPAEFQSPGLAVLGLQRKPQLIKHAALGDTFFRIYRCDCHFEQSNG